MQMLSPITSFSISLRVKTSMARILLVSDRVLSSLSSR